MIPPVGRRGYFGIGVDHITKPVNLGALFRTAHAFDASFIFTIGGVLGNAARVTDTADTPGQVPYYAFADADALTLPQDCALVGVEMAADAVDLPSFRHPRCAAYVLGAERHGLSPAVLERCAYIVRIPTRFSINLAVAGALVLYDRLLTVGRFAERPVVPGGPAIPLAPHVHGAPKQRKRSEKTL